MTICDRFEIVVVPFPFVDVAFAKPRPALVLSRKTFNRDQGQTVLAMITTAARSAWPSDVAIINGGSTGLRAPSILRFKLFTLPNALIARTIGRLARADANNVAAAVTAVLG